tara:strand:+ start:3543 stop:4790 length:1248 start_codon:yes stop_codon:yes gene_type:complete
MKPKPVLLFLVDALGIDFISDQTMPYLSNLAKNHALKPMTPVLGYSDVQRASLFTGCYPQDIGYWTDFRMIPNSSPLKLFSRLSFLDYIPSDFIRRVIKYFLAKTLSPIQARITGYKELPLYNIPLRVIQHFQPSLKKSMFEQEPFQSVPTIFDLCRQHEQEFAVVRSDVFGLRHMFSKASSVANLVSKEVLQINPNVKLLYVYLHTIDMLGHRYGIRSHKFKDVLLDADQAIKTIVEAARERLGESLEVAIVSDHGMNHTQEFIDYTYLLKQPGFGKDYIVALDSTMVRLWYFTEGAKHRMHSLVEESQHGTFLTPKELRELGVHFTNSDYYQEVYLLRPGLSIFPNYHSYLKPFAMHAYHPKFKDQTAVAFFIGSELERLTERTQKLDIVDIMPILKEVLGFNKSTYTNHQKS